MIPQMLVHCDQQVGKLKTLVKQGGKNRLWKSAMQHLHSPAVTTFKFIVPQQWQYDVLLISSPIKYRLS